MDRASGANRLDLWRSANRECARKKPWIELRTSVDSQGLNQVDRTNQLRLRGQAEDATARRNLEDAIGIVRGFILLALAVMIGGIIVVGDRMLFESVVNAMRR